MLRRDEKFCISSLETCLGGEWAEGEDPPDAYLRLGRRKIGVEISTLTQHVTDDNGGSKPRLSEDSTGVRLCNELNEELKEKIPTGQMVLLILTAPVTSARKLKPRLGREIIALVESTGAENVTVQRKILGNTITIHHIPDDRPSGKKIVGVVQNKKSNPDILANVKAILVDRIATKAQKCKHLTSSGPVWLVLFNDYWLADTDTYNQAMAQISCEHPFERIYIVSGDKSVAVLYAEHNYTLRCKMTRQTKILLWFGLVLSIPATYYAGTSVVFYAWLNAAEPDRWPVNQAALWSYGALVLTVLFLGLFLYCVISLIKEANRKHREEQKAT